jgi:hypothetical protein
MCSLCGRSARVQKKKDGSKKEGMGDTCFIIHHVHKVEGGSMSKVLYSGVKKEQESDSVWVFESQA